MKIRFEFARSFYGNPWHWRYNDPHYYSKTWLWFKCGGVYDLQAVLRTSSGDISTFYYKSKLATYNFTMYDIVLKQGYCYIWNKICAKRGANEIGTCVLSFFEQKPMAKILCSFQTIAQGKTRTSLLPLCIYTPCTSIIFWL